MLAGNVSPMTGENVKPAYGGDEEAFLTKVVSPIYDVIAQVLIKNTQFASFFFSCNVCCYLMGAVPQEAAWSKVGKSKHSQWRNYDDLNEYFW